MHYNSYTLFVTDSSLVNVAFNKPTMQSSVGWGGVPQRAVDGNTNGAYGQDSCTHTKSSNRPHWWGVDMGIKYVVDSVKIYNRNGISKYT